MSGKFLFKPTGNFLIITISFFITRFLNLLSLPIFNDEAIYIDWGTKEISTKGLLFYSLYDGKPPLLMWLFGISHKILSDPLLAARLVSVIAGFLTLIGIYKLSIKYFDRRTARLASIIYIIIPLFVFFDRQALMESSIAAVGIWSIYYFLDFLEKPSLKSSFLLGVIWGIGIFIKQTALIFFIAQTIVYAWLIFKVKGYKFNWNYILSVYVSQIILIPLYLHKTFWTTLSSNSRFVLNFKEMVSFPLSTWANNILAFSSITFWYLFPPLLILMAIGIYGVWSVRDTSRKILITYFLLCLLIILATARTLSPRYLVSFLPLSSIFAGFSLSFLKLKSRLLNLFLFLSAILAPSMFTVLLITMPIRYFDLLSNITSYSQKDEYISKWTSGYAVTEAIKYLKFISNDHSLAIGVRVDAGNPESAVFAYFNNSRNIPTYFDKRITSEEIFKYDCISASIPFYFIARDDNQAGMNKFLILDRIFKSPTGESFVSVYTLKSDCKNNILKVNIQNHLN